MGVPGALVPNKHVVTCADSLVEELVQGDRPVDEIRLGQASALLEALEVVSGLRDQGNSDPLRWRLPGDIFGFLVFRRSTARSFWHLVQSSSVGIHFVGEAAQR